MQKNTRGTVNPADCFKFQVEDRVQCTQSNKVKYTSRSEYCLSLPIPMEATTNKGTSSIQCFIFELMYLWLSHLTVIVFMYMCTGIYR